MIPAPIVRKTTPRHIFRFPADINPAECREMQVCYSQDGNIVLTKSKSDLSIDGQVASLVLSQSETALFTGGKNVDIEFWVMLSNGVVPVPYKTTEFVLDVIGGDFSDS